MDVKKFEAGINVDIENGMGIGRLLGSMEKSKKCIQIMNKITIYSSFTQGPNLQDSFTLITLFCVILSNI